MLHRLTKLLCTLFTADYSWPAIDITLPGKRHLHLVGSIHMGTQDMDPLPKQLISKLSKADALIVEADISGTESPFDFSDRSSELSQRLPPSQLEKIRDITHTLNIPFAHIDHQPAWQVALILQAYQAQQLGLQSRYGIDYQLLQAAKNYAIHIMELEGTQYQLDILKQLPREGLSLLNDTLIHWHTNARLLQTLISWWITKPPARKNISLPNVFGDDLYDVLMHKRNHQWYTFLYNLPAGNYVVAVGALHLYGEGNLPDLLKNK